MASARTKV
ncbi:hypothetical protein LINGRAHAP2_LOCUS9674 [Linum grandiflorum]